jgi:hypothetical protein
VSSEGQRQTFKPPVGGAHLVLLLAIGALGLTLGYLLRSMSMMLVFAVLWLVPVGILAVWRRSFVREVTINPDRSLDVLLYSGNTKRVVSAEGLSHELKRMGRMEYIVVTGASGRIFRIAIFKPDETNAARSFFGRAV